MKRVASSDIIAAVIRPSSLGWFGIAADAEGVCFVTIGHPTKASARERLEQEGCAIVPPSEVPLWLEQAAGQIAAYLDGDPVDFSGIPLSLPRLTNFQQNVVEALRRVGYGRTLSYADLARLAGRPGAARAVGNVMRTNRLPLLVPCHRVIGAGNRLGGFSAPSGVTLKAALLQMELGNDAPQPGPADKAARKGLRQARELAGQARTFATVR
jgi:methylated-DNA-[protein]-cysteine S-methyltransferase